MLDTGQQLPIKERVSTYLYFSSLYFIAVGILYLWGYWASFDVNILEYLSLADILKSAAYPIASTFIFFIFGALEGHLLSSGPTPKQGGGQNTRIGKVFKKWFPLLALMYCIGTFTLLLFGPPQKWSVLPVLIAIPVSLLIDRHGLFKSMIPESKFHFALVLLLVTLPIFSYGLGILNAATILDGVDYKYVASQIDGIPISDDADPSQRLRFLGQAGDFLFLLHPVKNTLIVMKYEQAKILQLKRVQVQKQPANIAVEQKVKPAPLR